MLDIDKLVALRAVAAQGSIAAAGRELGYTRSAISQQLSALERAAGTALLLRSGNTVTVTPVGRRLLEHTERILSELRAADATLRQASGEVAGSLRVGVPFREGPPMMSSALTGVRREHPKLEITLTATTDQAGPDEVRNGRLDMVIQSRFGATPGAPEPGLREWVLGRDPLRLCVPTDHRLARRRSCSITELRDDWWVLSPTGTLGQLLLGLCAAAGFHPSVAATVDDVSTAVGLAAVGWGVTIAPELTPVRSESSVKRIPLKEISAYRHTVLVIRDGEENAPAIAAVVAAAHASAAKFAFES
jgi:DNA-binding transcriptional LysR family regulator